MNLPPKPFFWGGFGLLYLCMGLRYLTGLEVFSYIGLAGILGAETAFFWVNRNSKWFWISVGIVILLAFITSTVILVVS